MVARLRAWARRVRRELHVLAIAVRDPRTPWHARAVAALVLAYALSPIDLIPDPIPVLGLLDDAILLPLGILLARRLTPDVVLEDARQVADERVQHPVSRAGAALVVATWLAVVAAVAWWLVR